MKTVSEDFRNELKDIRELNGLIVYKSLPSRLVTQADEPIITQDGKYIGISEKDLIYNVLATEHSSLLATEAEKVLATEREKIQLDNEAINSIKIEFNGNLLKSICRYITIDSKRNIPLNTKINAKIGLNVNGSMEYIDEGFFYNIEPGKWQLDTNSYIITGYDRMYRCMKNYDDEPLTDFPMTHRELLESILNKFGIEYNISSYDNEDYVIDKDYWIGLNVTYRDIVDELCSSGGFSLLIENNIAVNKVYYDTQELVDAEEMQDVNVSIGEKYGPINMVTTKDTDDITYILGQDDVSIEQNGLCEFNLGVNRILINDAEGTLYSNVFNAIKGLEFYLHDISTFGLLVFDPLDMFEVKYRGRYKTILLNDTLILQNGLTENIYIEKPEESVEEYTTSTVDDEGIKNAVVNINKANAQIVLKVNSDNRIAEVELNGDADEGSAISFKADQIDFEATTFDLTAKNMSIISENFSVDAEGNMECKDAKITGGDLILNSADGDPQILITNEGSLDGSFANLQINGGGFQVYDKVTSEPYAGLYTFGSTEYEIGPHSEFYLSGEFGIQIVLDGLLGLMSGGCLNLGGGNRGDGFIEIMDENNNTPIFITAEDGSIECVSLTQTSKKESKKNFVKLENALDIVKDVDIYKYNFVKDNDDEKKHIGFVIGDEFKYREEITSKRNDGVDIYSMVSVLWKAVQEQQKEIEELKEVIYGNRKD